MSRPFLRRLAIVFAASVVLSGIGGAQAEEVLRIGFQKSSTLLTLIRSQGTFERELARQGIRVSWHEFPSGLPLLESLNVGNVDLSADVADTVPVFAQAAGARLTYFARETPSPAAQAILVGEHSPLKSLAELKGKRIAVTKAAGSHYLLIAALASAGLEFSDIQPAYLTPADGRAAFENGKVDAWVTWDPYVASAQRQQRARVLADGQGLASYQRYYLASSDYARKHPEVLQQVFAELQRTGRWLKSHPADAAKVLGPLWGNLDAATVEQANARRSYDVQPVSADGLDEQQRIVDAFHAQGLLPKPVDARAVEVWQPRH
ncbi:aliphatic sulfonate ABC transporter substrate-binding protein [Pseudomonas aeruginosa]|uniref:aliphatic sulfonate ABC transporter substrate-binding protein n=1 Tax=Pseudomonas aeruginosa TaxID=287 RepID=UPI000939C53F|nr:aliphatic sulfonate ABC transporter substrate-binding protein [Pseudomonas aeruginosa]EKB8023205.1 aliphatic sulfonate ABC transporter substrate-binding protein [Pseudomonas aeruginosa]EKT7964138.1 aliphatic sulfonate ABC transporter substrate-binding protein [Pseudomonas aeruginosa]MBH9197627.1 aliphatic sulfonate ABC transporter substrate-binding protein [Pseudomonas aeruginosa]MBH9226957.1 aliphatic sulfonate ABC transporter substrate-binding protein [Pseudomonas aeruginosa]MCO2145296.1 